ncbi:MAG: hypothetical protein K8R37_04825, partial [Bacteroidales bacterium]|nr:hypothetical protein [Bacteroidales bacterium]
RDILGRELAHYENILNRGNHAFSFYPANAKYYLLTVIGKQTSQTIKMLNAGSYTTNGEKCKIVYTGNKGNVSGFKSQQAINDFAFNLGDSLQYTGYANSIDGIFGSAVMQHKPQEDTIYVFDILKGLRCPGIPTVTDIDGNTYNTVQIDSQCWLKENLNVGTMINGGQNMTNNGSIEKYCYDNNLSNCITYGGLYQWDEIMQYVTTQGVQGICPTGWHVPTDDEWTALTDFIGGTPPHGDKLKSCRQVDSPLGGGCNTTEHPRWNQTNYAWGTDDYGFSGLPGGYRLWYSPFVTIGNDGFWWSSTENLPEYAWARSLINLTSYVYTNHMSKESGFSVRCLRD